MTDVQFFVPGVPAPQGSKRHVGNGRMVESSKKVAPWRHAVIQKVQELDLVLGLIGPLEVTVSFLLPAPKTLKRQWPSVRPDLDKLLRSTFDALTISGLWIDDSQVIALMANKKYGRDQQTGAFIRIQLLTHEGAGNVSTH
jgi:crossover junction endodeoxyribonuclease RusA